jgi:Ca2+-binding RTX toxin-like protein
VTLNPKQDAYGDFVTGLVGGGLYLLVGETSSVTILGGEADDSFLIGSIAFDASIRIDGGGGTNTLDYSSVTQDVVVNLPLGTATGLTGGIGNVRNVIGGAGDDTLVGDAAGNTLRGGPGRDLLIGGLGADLLDGGADDDILIGGTTAYDANPTALDAIMKEWTRTDLDVLGPPGSYRARIDHLQSGGGLNGAYVLKSSKGNGTVFNDGLADVLTGGEGLDWFFGDKKQDSIATVPPEKVS